MDGRLYQASLKGNTTSLLELLEEDELLLDRVLAADIPETPLHIAALRGHLTFASEILHRRPEIAHELNSEGLSALHLASANGHVVIVEEILKVVPDSVWDRNRQGQTPLHTAAMKGRVEVLNKIACCKPESVQDVTNLGETALHLCVKNGHLEAMKMMVGLIADVEFVNRKDANGSTVLHLSSALKNFPVIKFLLEETRVEVNEKNANGLTALDVLTLYPKESSGDMEIAEFLRQKGGKRSWELPFPSSGVSEIALAGDSQFRQSHPSLEVGKPGNISPRNQEKNEEAGIVVALESLSQQIKQQWLQEMKQKRGDDKRNTMMVVAILIMTVTIQATLTPPGGLWQDDSNVNTTYNSTNATLPSEEGYHRAGTAILNNTNPTYLAIFWFFNKLAFFASLILMLSLSDIDDDEKKTATEVEFARKRRSALFFCAWFSMELMYLSSSLPITGAYRLRVAVADVGAIVLVLLIWYSRSHKLWRKLRCKDKIDKPKSDGDDDIAIETQK